VRTDVTAPLLDDLRRRVATVPGLTLLVLHGSRARGDARVDSDWDFGWLGDAAATLDPDALLATLAEATHADRIDLVDLERAGALLRYRVARDGVVVFERDPERFLHFWIDAVGTWCDLEPVLTPAYEHVLGTLPK
jgi:predicted nucleotidyltransferase